MSNQNNKKSLVKPNENATMPESVVLPEELQQRLNNYFGYLGDLPELEERTWSFLETAANGCEEVGLGSRQIADWMFIYRRTYDLVKFLHNYVTPLKHTTI